MHYSVTGDFLLRLIYIASKLQVLSQRHPWVHKLLEYEDEVFALVIALLDWHSLSGTGATFSESLYGLRRRSTTPNAQVNDAITRNQVLAGLACQVGGSGPWRSTPWHPHAMQIGIITHLTTWLITEQHCDGCIPNLHMHGNMPHAESRTMWSIRSEFGGNAHAQVLLPYAKAKLDALYKRHSGHGVLGLAVYRASMHDDPTVGDEHTAVV